MYRGNEQHVWASGEMARTNERQRLFGHRSTLYRISDRQVAHGWITAESHQTVTIETLNTDVVAIGDKFLIEVFAIGRRVRILGEAKYLCPVETNGVRKTNVVVTLDSWLDSVPTEGNERQRVRGLFANLIDEVGVIENECPLLDVSLTGICVQTCEKLEVGKTLMLMSELGSAHFEATVVVRNCVPTKETGLPTYRTGLSLEGMDRLSQAKWRTLLTDGLTAISAA